MFYQPDRKMTITILTNYRGAKLYNVARALFEALPHLFVAIKTKKKIRSLFVTMGITFASIVMRQQALLKKVPISAAANPNL
jgi:hypothetical protein